MPDFKEYIKGKIDVALDASTSRGLQRDESLLASILNVLFWTQDTTTRRDINNISFNLKHNYPEIKSDTLRDNLNTLISLGFITSGSSDRITPKGGRPRKIYTLNDYYIKDFYMMPHQHVESLCAAIACNKIPCQCGLCEKK